MHRSGSAQVALVGTNAYVKAMQYAAEVVHGQPTAFSLGSPLLGTATAVGAAVPANSVANFITPLTYTSDVKFGRTVIMTISGNPGNACVHDLIGYDYLGQPMIERFTGANGVTAVLYGQKAFYRIIGLKTITPASNAVTYGVGTGSRLGLPFKGDVAWAKEGGVQQNVFKRDIVLGNDRSAALAIAGGSVFVRAPSAGFIKNVRGWPFSGGSTNNPVITVKLATVAIVGLTCTIIDNVTTTASIAQGVPTTPGYNANNRCIPGDLIELAGTASAAAAGDRLEVTFTPTQFLLPDLTDPQTRVTGEPRGAYDPVSVLNGATEIIVGLVGDSEVNAANNGGLHGLAHFGG